MLIDDSTSPMDFTLPARQKPARMLVLVALAERFWGFCNNLRIGDRYLKMATFPNYSSRSSSGPDRTARQRFQALHNEHHDDVWKYAARRATSIELAEEIVNDTFLVAWRQLEAVPEGPNAKPWLFAVARNQLRNSWRKTQRYNRLKNRLAIGAESPISPDPATRAPSGSDNIVQALGLLRDRDAEILKLVAWEGLSNSEIAVTLGCTPNTVASRIHRARTRLGHQLKTIQNEVPQKCNPPTREDLNHMKDTHRQPGEGL